MRDTTSNLFAMDSAHDKDRTNMLSLSRGTDIARERVAVSEFPIGIATKNVDSRNETDSVVT